MKYSKVMVKVEIMREKKLCFLDCILNIQDESLFYSLFMPIFILWEKVKVSLQSKCEEWNHY